VLTDTYRRRHANALVKAVGRDFPSWLIATLELLAELGFYASRAGLASGAPHALLIRDVIALAVDADDQALVAQRR
jgi:hypothetical protein